LFRILKHFDVPIVEGDDFERRKKENGKGGIHHAMCNEIDGWANKPSRKLRFLRSPQDISA